MNPLDDTIAAVASPPGGGARGIVRLSGPGVADCLANLFRADADDGPQSPDDWRRRTHPTAVDGRAQPAPPAAVVPCQVLFWPEGRGYTGQEAAELHTFGSPPLLDSLLRACCEAGARPAERGEFTLRAFLGGRIDLTQAEAVAALIEADGPDTLRAALAQLAGGLAGPLRAARDRLLDLLAQLEAGFDFADEDITFLEPDELLDALRVAGRAVAVIRNRLGDRALADESPRVVLVGRPNTGKSSLFNALATGADAIVSEWPGTTRDYLAAELRLDGLRAELVDAPGAASPDSPAADEHLDRAACLILCIDSTRPLDAWERAELARAERRRLVVLTKCDAPRRTDYQGEAVATSGATGLGLDALRTELATRLAAGSGSGDVVPATAVRCRRAIDLAAESLTRAEELCRGRVGEELAAAEIRAALAALGEVAGAAGTDDLLDHIFSRFCIGK